MKMPDDVARMIADLFNGPLYQVALFYRYARMAEGGCIVDLGVFRGRSTIVMALGTRDGNGLTVYSVDDYRRRTGWIGEPYGPQDMTVYLRNVEAAGVQDRVKLIQMDILETASAWSELWEHGIGLVLWDLGMPRRFRGDFEVWGRYVVPRGHFIVKDTPKDDLKTRDVIYDALDSGAWEKVEYELGISVLRKS